MRRRSCSSARRAPGLPQHGGPPAPSGPRHRPGCCRLRSPARRSRPGEGARQLAERTGTGRGAPGGRRLRAAGCWSGAFPCLGATCWSLTSIGDKSEEEAASPGPGRRLSRPAARSLSAVRWGAGPAPPPRPAAPSLPRRLSAAGRMRRAKQTVKDFGGRSQAAIRN